MSDRCFPRSVYGVGEEPDPRFSLANERTFLAWIRTSLSLLAVGIALEALQLPIAPALRFAASLVFVALAILAAGYAWVSWQRTERSLRANRALPALAVDPVIAVGVMIGMVLIIVGFLLP